MDFEMMLAAIAQERDADCASLLLARSADGGARPDGRPKWRRRVVLEVLARPVRLAVDAIPHGAWHRRHA